MNCKHDLVNLVCPRCECNFLGCPVCGPFNLCRDCSEERVRDAMGVKSENITVDEAIAKYQALCRDNNALLDALKRTTAMLAALQNAGHSGDAGKVTDVLLENRHLLINMSKGAE